MINFAIGSLQLISGGVPAPGYILQTPIEGLDSPEYRDNAYSLPGQSGGNVSSMFYDVRIMNIKGKINANNPVDYHAYRKALATACAIMKDNNGYPVPIRVTFTTLDGNSYFCDAYFSSPKFNLDNPLMSEFFITMKVTNPFIFGSSQVSVTGITPAAGGGFILAVILPITSSSASGGTVTATNNGNVETYPLITIAGAMTNPSITNNTTGKTMTLNTTINSGDSVVIDMLNKTIVQNGSSSLIGTKSPDSDWWTLQPGANQIALTSGSTSDTGNVSMTYYNAYLGV